MNWYIDVLKKYFVFEGRARRKEFWMFTLFNFIALIIVAAIDGAVGAYGILYGIYALGTLLPNLGLSVRRLHDTDRSGWWLLLSLVPIAGLAVIVFFAMEGTSGSNRFGPDPKA